MCHAMITISPEQMQGGKIIYEAMTLFKNGQIKRVQSIKFEQQTLWLPVGVVGRLDVLGRDDVERQHRVSSAIVHLSFVSDAA